MRACRDGGTGRRSGLKISTANRANALIEAFVKSRRAGLSPRTNDNYRLYLKHASEVISLTTTGVDIQRFIDSRNCTNGGKHAYFRCLRAFYNWLYSPRSEYKLNSQNNPIVAVEAPKVEKKILPSLTTEQVELLIDNAECTRDKAIISLFADSGLRLNELATISTHNINWQNRLIKVRCKGSKEGYAPFGQHTEVLLRDWISEGKTNGTLWNLDHNAIYDVLRKLRSSTGLPCNPHSFRRTFASVLAKRGVDSLHIMRLGRWESMAMVERYTRSVRFADSMKLYSPIINKSL